MSSSGIAGRSLASLPLEILRRIIEFGPCESALALRGVCHTFKGICDDPLIYAAIIENGNGLDTIPTLADSDASDTALKSARSLKWWNNVRKHSAGDGAAASRWALADSRISCWLQDLSNAPVDTKPATEAGDSDTEHPPALPEPKLWKALKWLPELILASHPGASMVLSRTQSELVALVQLAEVSESANLQWRASLLCGAYDEPEWMSHTKLGMGFNAAFPSPSVIEDSSRLVYPFSPAHQVHALLALRHFRRRLNHSLEQRDTSPLDHPPLMHHIPFSFHVHLTPPFQPESSTSYPDFDKMTSTSFLEDGEWVGYYNYGRAVNGFANVDPIMKGVRFQAEHGDNEVTVSSPTGYDMHGPFTLVGSIRRSDGWVEMTKHYASGVEWRWAASMTPFGIVGLWGNYAGRRFILGGRLFLWKRSWAATADAS